MFPSANRGRSNARIALVIKNLLQTYATHLSWLVNKSVTESVSLCFKLKISTLSAYGLQLEITLYDKTKILCYKI